MDRKWWTLIAVCAGTFMLLLDVTIVVVALPEIQRGLRASFGDVQWVVDAYALALASLLLTAGVLADRHGRRLAFAVGLVIFTAGSLTCGLAASAPMLIASRAGQGVGGAVMFATGLALLGDSFSGPERGLAFGIWGAITGAAVSLGPILGGLITSGISWRGIFLVNVPIGVVAVVIVLARVAESRAELTAKPDWAGFVLLTSGLFGVVYGLIRASEASFSEPLVMGALAGGTALLAGFVAVEATVSSPLFDLGLFRIPTFTGGLLAALCMNGSLFALFVYLVIYLQDVLGLSAVATGLRLLASSGALFLTAALSGRLAERLGVRWFIAPGLALVGVGLLLMTGLSADSSWLHLLPGLVIAGLGSGMVNPPLAATAIGVVEPARAGMASGINSTFRQIGFAGSVAALGSTFGAVLSRHLAAVPSSRRLAAAVKRGQVAGAMRRAPAAERAHLATVVRGAFAAGINELALITAVVAFFGAAAGLLLLRQRDFVHGTEESSAADAPMAVTPQERPGS